MTTAYLLAVFRLDGDIPVFMGTEIFSEPNPTMSQGRITFIVDEADGHTFEEAKRRLIENVSSRPWQKWALRTLVERR